MTRKRNINCPSQYDAGSSSQAARQLPWHIQAVNLLPFQHFQKPSPAVIQAFHSMLYSISHQLPLSRRQK
ncbi:hypothetical protein LINGRAHAP2_LOCUS14580 [Linum grandiflorum]